LPEFSFWHVVDKGGDKFALREITPAVGTKGTVKFVDMIDPVSDIHVGCATEMRDVASERGGTNAVTRTVGDMETMPRDFSKFGILDDVHLTIWGGINDLSES
jgi:hypothetical protein